MKKSFSLIEVLVFAGILQIFFIAALSTTVFFVRNLKNEEYKILASYYLGDLSEWLRYNKDIDWNGFSKRSSPSGMRYCFNSLNWNNQGSCSSYGLGNPPLFKRELVLTTINPPDNTRIEAHIFVSWDDSGVDKSVNSKIILTPLD
ncbi:MAG: hypothetical protein NZL96_03120 [Patescibacteria group bacterium]|nr:hypothetical protein [Patescibacteria group bacterium]